MINSRPAHPRAIIIVLVALFAGKLVAGTPTPVLSLADADITERFLERRHAVIEASIASVDPTLAVPTGSYLDIALCLRQGRNVEQALARLAQLNEPMPTANMFWAYPMATLMAAGGNQIDAASWNRIQELWRIYWPSRGDTENHWAMSYASRYLAAQTWPEAGPENWFNGRSSAENLAEARDYLMHWMWVTTSYGQGEYDSPQYFQEYVIPMAMLAGWAQDPVVKQKARMMLDYLIYDYAVENVDGYYGGAHSRVYPKQIVAPGNTPSSNIGWLLFGFGEQRPDGANTLLALSGYVPPPILERVARDRDQPYVERELKRTRWRMRNAGPLSFTIGDKRTIPVYKYSYVDRDFVLGSSQGGLLQPIQQQTWSLDWRTDKPMLEAANTFFGVQPYSSPYEGTMFFGGDWDTVTDLIARSKADYDSEDKLPSGSRYEQVFQQGTALIALYDMPEGNRFSHIITFFSRDLAKTMEDASGWIFTQGGPVYIAYRPFAPGVWKPNDWTGLLAGGAGGFISTNADKWGVGHKCLVSDALRNGYVVQVAPVRDYASFDDFKAAVRALPLTFSTQGKPEATFTALDGSVLHARYGDTPSVNGVEVNYADWPLFDSPFAHEQRGSQRLEIQQGGERLLLDFAHPSVQETAESAQR
ncbi:MAG: hypothetical protein K9M98_10630 [Cephaloticoccus sp.]|nr:hypothetical protein [Cephaloticoccus sp.]MCF7760946.1 hypothetical protein [Cephaloticoccus sp.]